MAVPGTWNIFGYNLPDYGKTEQLTGGSFGGTALNNPAIATPANILSPIGAGYTAPVAGGAAPSPWTTTQTTQQTGTSYQQQWEAAGHQGIAPVGYHGESGSGSSGGSASQQDLDAIYNPGMQNLQQQEDLYRSQLPGAETAIETSYDEGLSLLNKNLSEQEASLAKQQNTINTTKGSALSQARQLYNELAQRYGSMFGSRTSAGPAAMEILGRETQKQFGAINQGSTQATQDVEGERSRLQSWVSDQQNTMAQKKRDAIAGIQNTFAAGLAQIASQRGALESAKASARYNLLQQAQQQVQQAEAATTAFQNQITMFQQQRQATLDQMQYARQLQGFNAPDFKYSQMGTTGTQQASTSFAPTYRNQQGQLVDQNGRIIQQ